MGTAPLVAVAIALTFLEEPVSAALLVGAGLIVAGGFALANERVRPEDFRRLGVLFAVGATVLFAVRDNVLRAIARDTTVDALVAAPVSLLAGTRPSPSTCWSRGEARGAAATARRCGRSCLRGCYSGSPTRLSSRLTTAAA